MYVTSSAISFPAKQMAIIMEKFWLPPKEPNKEKSSAPPYPEEAPAYPAAMTDE
jgi:hypothetical protein